jgi:uncharacterized membrane protein YeaQ/YmgE (transglycosylase-associated protein family)
MSGEASVMTPYPHGFSLSRVVALFQHCRISGEKIHMAPLWLLAIGILTGLAVRTIVGGNAYGAVADALLAVTGAFGVDWVLGQLNQTPKSWLDSTLFTIWGGAAAMPLLAHLFARRTTRQLRDSASGT